MLLRTQQLLVQSLKQLRAWDDTTVPTAPGQAEGWSVTLYVSNVTDWAWGRDGASPRRQMDTSVTPDIRCSNGNNSGCSFLLTQFSSWLKHLHRKAVSNWCRTCTSHRLLDGNDWIKQDGATVVIYTPVLFSITKDENVIRFKPRCHLLARKSVGHFSPPSFLITTPTAWLPHCGSCSYIQNLTSAMCSTNMCTSPVKPNHWVRGCFTMRSPFYNSILQTKMCPPSSRQTLGRIQTKVLSVTAGFLLESSLVRRSLWCFCV